MTRLQNELNGRPSYGRAACRVRRLVRWSLTSRRSCSQSSLRFRTANRSVFIGTQAGLGSRSNEKHVPRSRLKRSLIPQASPTMASTMETRFTDKQGQYLCFIYYYTKLNGRAPAEEDMARNLAVTQPAVHQMLLKMR